MADSLQPFVTMAERRPRLTAAPPDSAGHQGDFTRPDALLTFGADWPASDSPPLNTDTTEARPIGTDAGATFLVVTSMAVVSFALFGIYLP